MVAGRQNQCLNSSAFGGPDLDEGCFGTAVAWDVSALFRIPQEIASEDAGPLMCGGATVWNTLYSYGAKPGDRVGILGIGGLGHMAIQFASKMGYQAVVFSGTKSKRQEAMDFGAAEFHDTNDPQSLLGAQKIDYLLITTSVMPDLIP